MELTTSELRRDLTAEVDRMTTEEGRFRADRKDLSSLVEKVAMDYRECKRCTARVEENENYDEGYVDLVKNIEM